MLTFLRNVTIYMKIFYNFISTVVFDEKIRESQNFTIKINAKYFFNIMKLEYYNCIFSI